MQISGTWDAVADPAGRAGWLLSPAPFVATLVYDDAALDVDPSSGFGAYFTAAASSDL